MSKIDANKYDFASRILFESCALDCNPSYSYRMIMRGSRDNEKHLHEMEKEKLFCLKGCGLSGFTVSRTVASTLNSSEQHEKILDSKGKKDSIIDCVEAVRKLKRATARKCHNICSKTSASEKILCLRGCAGGVNYYFDILKDAF
ncbi:hypothetical protein AAMO2058_001466400 [Amorphochlora amoebiformis]